jgi:hypothetical protein
MAQDDEAVAVVVVPPIADDSAGEPPSNSAPAQQQPGRRTLAASGPKIIETSKKIGGDSYAGGRIANPPWLAQRAALFDQVAAQRAIERATKIPVEISITLPDGTVHTHDTKNNNMPLRAWETTPLTIATMISQGLADASAVARVTYSSFVTDYSLSEDGMDGVRVAA